MDGFVRRESSARTGSSPMRRQIGQFAQASQPSRARPAALRRPRRPARDNDDSIALNLPEDITKKRNKKRLSSLSRLPKIRTMALVLLIAFGSYFITAAYLKARDVFRGGGGAVALEENIDPGRLSGEGDGRVNILLLGKDDAGGLTDTIIVASIDPIHDEAALLSVPRDLYVRVEGLGEMKINEVFPNARNAALAQQATERQAEARAYRTVQDKVHDVVGIPMHYYVTIDFDGFRRAIDTVGGVTLDVDQPVYEQMYLQGRNYVLNVGEGEETFDGTRALAYVRSRKTSPRGDFDRSERQRELLIALRDEIMSSDTLTNPSRMNSLFNDFANNVNTSFSFDELLRLREIGAKIDTDNIESLELVGNAPHDYIVSSMLNGLSIQQPRAGMFDYSEIQRFVRMELRDGYLRSEDATVLVLNGTDKPELASRMVDELESYGYTVVESANSLGTTQRETVLADLTDGQKKYTKRYLEQRMRTFASSRLPSGTSVEADQADFVILIGQDEVTRRQN